MCVKFTHLFKKKLNLIVPTNTLTPELFATYRVYLIKMIPLESFARVCPPPKSWTLLPPN